MLKSDAELLINSWWVSSAKVFRYIREFLFDEYILIYKKSSEEFRVDPTSTFQLPDMDLETISKMLQRGELIYFSDPRFGETPREIKTGGCDCGTWWMKEAKHASWCYLVTKGKKWMI